VCGTPKGREKNTKGKGKQWGDEAKKKKEKKKVK